MTIVESHHATGKDWLKGGYAHNVYVFQRLDVAEAATLTEPRQLENPCVRKEDTVHSAEEAGSKRKKT